MVEKYFNGERLQCGIGIAMALISISVGVYFLLQLKKPFTTGMSYPFLIIPGFLLMICIAVIIRSSKDIVRVNQMVQRDKPKIKTEELPRMETVMRNFKIIKRAEMAVVVVGLLLYVFLPAGTFWRGVGLGLTIQASMMLFFDLVAESRGKVYLGFLQKLV